MRVRSAAACIVCICVAVALSAASSACGSKLPPLAGAGGDDDSDAGDDGGASGGDDTAPVLGATSSGDSGALIGNGNAPSGGDGGNQAGCTDAAKLVYVVDLENTLHSFDPGSLTFSTNSFFRNEFRNKERSYIWFSISP